MFKIDIDSEENGQEGGEDESQNGEETNEDA